MKQITLIIDGFDNRRDLVGILAENGYRAVIERHDILNNLYYVIIDVPDGCVKEATGE